MKTLIAYKSLLLAGGLLLICLAGLRPGKTARELLCESLSQAEKQAITGNVRWPGNSGSYIKNHRRTTVSGAKKFEFNVTLAHLFASYTQ